MSKTEAPEYVYTSIYSRIVKTYFTEDRVPLDSEKPKRKKRKKKKVDIPESPST